MAESDYPDDENPTDTGAAPADAKDAGARPDAEAGGTDAPAAAEGSPLPMWMSVTSVLVGIVLFAVFLVASAQGLDIFPGSEYLRITVAAGLGLILAGLGSRVEGRWGKWNLYGAAATVVVVYLVLWQTRDAVINDRPLDPVAILYIDEVSSNVENLSVSADEGDFLFVAYDRGAHDYRARIESENVKGQGCVKFNFVIRGEDVDDKVLIPNAWIRGKLDSIEEGNHEVKILGLKYAYNARRNSAISEVVEGTATHNPISTFGTSGCGVSTAASLRKFALLAGFAHAGEVDWTIENLVDALQNDNTGLRREARSVLANKGPDAVRPVMDALAAHPETYRVQLGAAVVLTEMLRGKTALKEVRGQLTQADLDRLTPLVTHGDVTLRKWATQALILLNDPRSSAALVKVVSTPANSNEGRYNAALVLSIVFEEVPEQQKAEISKGVRDKIETLGSKTQALLGDVVAYEVPDSGVEVLPSNTTGWAFFGTNFGKGWEENNFSGLADGALPKPGDRLTALRKVELSSDFARFDGAEGIWIEPDPTGILVEGEEVEVTAVELVSGGFYWIELTVGHAYTNCSEVVAIDAIDEAMLAELFPRADPAVLAAYAPKLREGLDEIGACEPHYIAAFLAQVGYATARFTVFEERGDGQNYEGRLGNSEPGDGAKFKGRGLFLLTGRANYTRFAEAIGEPRVVETPEIVATDPEISTATATWYFRQRNLLRYCDETTCDMRQITRRVTGGSHGLDERNSLYNQSLSLLAG